MHSFFQLPFVHGGLLRRVKGKHATLHNLSGTNKYVRYVKTMTSNSFLVLSLLLLASTILSPCNSTKTLNIASSAPSDASPAIDPSYPGFAFEQASFYNYSFDANGKPNTFSENLIHSVFKRTGGTPILRVGGTSGDFGSYKESQDYPVNRPATKDGPAFKPPFLTVGPSFFKAFKNFPAAKYVLMVPLVHRNLDNTVEWTRLSLDAIGDRLQALEIGNEPDLYGWFGVSAYVKAFLSFEKALTAKFPKALGGKPIYQALDTASGGWNKLRYSDAVQAGINSTGRISQVAYHFYQLPDKPNSGMQYLQRRVANHTALVAKMSVFAAKVRYLQENHPGTPFILSEVGNTLGRQDIEQRNILATALWNVDYQLHGMAIGVTRVNNQQIVLPGFQMWEPVVSDFGPPLVRANYYSQPLVAEFIGKSGITRVSELAIRGTDLLSAYVAYENDKPARIAIVNMELWKAGNGARPSVDLTLSDLPKSAKGAKVYTLIAPDGAYANDTLTWRGLQWTYKSNGLEVRVGEDSESVSVKDGKLGVTVKATSAVIVELESSTIATSLGFGIALDEGTRLLVQ